MFAKKLWARASTRFILEPLDMELKQRTPLAIIGESGAGKTTLLRILSGWDTGGLILGGRICLPRKYDFTLPVNAALALDIRRTVHLLPQTFDCLCPLVTIFGHIRQMDFARGRPSSWLEKRAETWFCSIWPTFSSASLAKYPGEFSGGEIRRLALVMMLLVDDGILLVDEPTSGVDHARRGDIVALLRQASASKPLAYTTHDLDLVAQIGGDVLLLRNGQAIEQATVETFFTQPSTDYGRTLVQKWKELKL